jgi:hypothetical protein
MIISLSVDDTIDFICDDRSNQESRHETNLNKEESDGKTILSQVWYK